MGEWVEVEHTADLALHIRAVDLADLFTTAALGMATLITDPTGVEPERAFEVELEAPDIETLLVDWLNELLYLGERERLTFVAFEYAQLEPLRLRAIAHAGKMPGYQRYVKAVTFHDLRVDRTAEGYETEIVFDT